MPHPTGPAKCEGAAGSVTGPRQADTSVAVSRARAWHGAHLHPRSAPAISELELGSSEQPSEDPAARPPLSRGCSSSASGTPGPGAAPSPARSHAGAPLPRGLPGILLGLEPWHPPAFGGNPDLTSYRRTYPEFCGGQKPRGGGGGPWCAEKTEALATPVFHFNLEAARRWRYSVCVYLCVPNYCRS